MAALHDALDGDNASGARETLRGLVEAIVLHSETGGLRVGVRGELSAVLGLGFGPMNDAERGAAQIKMVAGTRNDRRLLTPAVSC